MQKKQKIRLDDIEKRQMYTVPDDYFENLPATIRRRLNAAPVQENKLFPRLRYSIGVAGLFLVLFVGYTGYQRWQAEDPYQLISNASHTEIIHYLQSNDLSQYDIIEAASNADITIENQFFQQTDINSELLLDEADEKLILDYM